MFVFCMFVQTFVRRSLMFLIFMVVFPGSGGVIVNFQKKHIGSHLKYVQERFFKI